MKKSFILNADRTDLAVLLRPLADTAGERCNLSQLTIAALGRIEREVATNPDLGEWYDRTVRGALADRVYTELGILMKAKRLDITLPFLRNPIAINPRQGVRIAGMKEYQQTLFLAFTWDEYESWRTEQLSRFERAAGIRGVIQLIDRVRMLNPAVANIGAALREGGAKVTAIWEEGAA